MSVGLAKMLGRPQAEVAKFIEQMEDKFGYPSHDVRLLAEIEQKVRDKITSLGLDPRDTTAQELYHALQAKFADDAGQIDKALSVRLSTGFKGRLARATQLAKHVTGGAEVWVLKPTVAKNQLLILPPKKLMKQLHYRSAESMLKHENIGELYLLAPYVESNSWQSALAKACSNLASNNYVMNPINFVHPEVTRLEAIAQPAESSGINNKLTGAVTVWPARNAMDAPLITLTLMLLQAAQQLEVNIDKYALASVHPALSWWINMEHLISPQPSKAISLNFGDVAHNHLNCMNHENSVTHQGAKALWAELTNRYHSLSSDIEDSIEDEVSKLIPAQLAAQYQEA